MIGTQEKQVLSDLTTIINGLNLPMILVGAGARLLMFDRKFGEGRSTRDWDVAVAVDSWTVYQQLRNNLIEGNSPCFRATNSYHKFVHIVTNIEVDIVPFGEISAPDRQIVWSDSGNSMNVLGFDEALSSAKTIPIDDLSINVIDTPAFIVLKLFAWGDRSRGRINKDLEDIEFILSKYEDDNRAYEELAEELATGVVDFIDANIYLLGKDISKILRQETMHPLNALLNELISRADMDEPRSLEYKLKILQRGINAPL